MYKFLLFVFLVSISKSFASVGTGSCAKTPIISSFSAKRYAGSWYEIERFPVIYQVGLDCVRADYGYINDTAVTVKNQGVYLKSNNESTSVEGVATVPNINEPNRLIVEFFNVSRFFTVKGIYDVWSTDYDNYSLVYSCKSFLGILKVESAWILGRKKQLDEETVKKLKGILKDKGINVKQFTQTKQICDNV